jgi:hypothetical protein
MAFATAPQHVAAADIKAGDFVVIPNVIPVGEKITPRDSPSEEGFAAFHVMTLPGPNSPPPPQNLHVGVRAKPSYEQQRRDDVNQTTMTEGDSHQYPESARVAGNEYCPLAECATLIFSPSKFQSAHDDDIEYRHGDARANKRTKEE